MQEKLPLQPWLSIYEVASRMDADGHDVHIVTDTQDGAKSHQLNMHVVSSLRGSNKTEIYSVIDKLEPDLLVTLVTPLNLATGGWVSRYTNAQKIAFSSYPFYSFMELLRAVPHVKLVELKSYFRHLLVPGFIWKSKLKKNYTCVICQSESGRDRLLNLVGDSIAIHSVPPGIDLSVWKPVQTAKVETSTLRLIYLGTASDIRGFGICLKTYKSISSLDISLTVLARGASNQQLKEISKKLESLEIKHKTSLLGGWMDRNEMIDYINKADLVVLPFVLVPSELPVSVMEVIACGTPVITTDIDGLPSTVGKAGVIVRQGSCASLASAIEDIYDNRNKVHQLEKGCIAESARMYGWNMMYEKWLEKIDASQKR